MPPKKKSETPPKKAKTPKKKTLPRDDAHEDIPAVPVEAPDQNEIDRLEEEFLEELWFEEAQDEVPQDDLEVVPVEPAAEGGEREDVLEQPVGPDDDGDERMDVDEPPAPRGEEDALAAASGPRLRIRFVGAANPPPTPSEALQEMAAITTNWGAQYRTLRDCMPKEPKGTWLQGSTSGWTEHTCKFKTLRKLRELSDNTPNDGPAMMQQIRWRWEDRNNSGRVGKKKDEKEKNLRHDLRSMISGERWTQADVQKSKKKRAANGGAAPAAKRPRPSRNDSQRPSQDDEDDSSSGSDLIPHDGPAGGGEKTAAIAKKNGKAPTTGAASNAIQATVLTESQRGRALSDIYINWGIHSVYLSFPLALFQAGIASDTAIDLRVLARLLDLSNLHTGLTQGLAIRNRLVAQIQDRWRPASSVDEALALLAQFGGPTQATARTPGRPMTRATMANAGASTSMRERGQAAPVPTLGTTRLSAAEMLARQTRSDDGPRGQPMVRPGDRAARGNALPPNRLSSFSRNMLPTPGRHDPLTQLGGQRPSLAGNMVAPSDLRVLLRAAEHDATRADEQAAADMHRYEHSVLTAVDRHREVERIRGMVAQEDGGAEGEGRGKNGDDWEGGAQDDGNGKKKK
ncbi:hypothetical protein J4E81_009974 [Alternaria sp. BMP 2799]|nr:hypothetical protein J4E81_009974 [Alternaria sp. BMP 2799]